MKKHSKRRVRVSSPLISPEIHAQVMTKAHMHLQLFIAGNGTVDHLKSVASALNVGSVMAWQRGDGVRQKSLHRALDIVVECVSRRIGDAVPAPSSEASEELQATLLMLDRWIGIQNMHTLQQASAFINQALENRATADVKSVFGDGQ